MAMGDSGDGRLWPQEMMETGDIGDWRLWLREMIRKETMVTGDYGQEMKETMVTGGDGNGKQW